MFVLSSTGEGEPPDNARSFWRFLVRKTHPKDLMARLKFTILGSASFPPPCALLASPSASPCSLVVMTIGGDDTTGAGLGDTNYETYQQMPRRLEERLLELGAACFYKRGEADDATGCLHPAPCLLVSSHFALST